MPLAEPREELNHTGLQQALHVQETRPALPPTFAIGGSFDRHTQAFQII
jgi:hypothetical protein